MAQVRIVTDSNAHFTRPESVEQLDIEVVPLPVQVGRQRYGERHNHNDTSLLRKLSQDPDAVSVDAPSVDQMMKVFDRIGQTTDSIVCIHVSGALNDIAEIARKATSGFMGRQSIVVLDSATTAVGLGLIVEAAAQAAVGGAPLADIVRIVRGMIPHMYTLIFSDTLAYLEAWGRLGSAQSLLGTMLRLKPLSIMEDGDLLPIEKVRNYSLAVDKLYDFVIEFSRVEQMYLLQNDFETEAAQLLERLELVYPEREIPVIGYPPSLAVHIGPKAMGVIVYEGS